MKNLLILGFILLHCNNVQACLSKSRHKEISSEQLEHQPKPIINIIENNPEKIELTSKLQASSPAEVEVDNFIELTADIREISFPIKWTIKNWISLVNSRANEFNSYTFDLKHPEPKLTKQDQRSAIHRFYIRCKRGNDFLFFTLKKDDIENESNAWRYRFPTLGYITVIGPETIKTFNYYSKKWDYFDKNETFSLDRDFAIAYEDIKSGDVQIMMNVTILFEF